MANETDKKFNEAIENFRQSTARQEQAFKNFDNYIGNAMSSTGVLQDFGDIVRKDFKESISGLTGFAGTFANLPVMRSLTGMAKNLAGRFMDNRKQKKEDELLAKQLGMTATEVALQRQAQEIIKAEESSLEYLREAANAIGLAGDRIVGFATDGSAMVAAAQDENGKFMSKARSLMDDKDGSKGASAAEVEKQREEARAAAEQTTLLESIANNTAGMLEKFVDSLKTAGGMGLGAIAGLIAAPVVALAEFFRTLKAEFAFLKTLTNGGIAKVGKGIARLGELFSSFFTKIDNISNGKFGKLLANIDEFFKPVRTFFSNVLTKVDDLLQPIRNLFNNVKTFLGKFNPKNFEFFTKASGMVDEGVGFIRGMFNSVKNFLSPIKTGFLALDSAMGVFQPIIKFAAGLGRVLGKIFLPITVLMSVFDFVTGFMDGYDEGGIIGGIEGGITKLLQGLIGMPLDLLKGAVEWIGEALGFDMSFMEGFSFSELIGDLVGGIFDGVSGVFSFLGDLFDFSDMTLFEGFGKLVDIVFLPLNLAINFVKGLFGWGSEDEDEPFSLFGFVTGAFQKAWDWITGIFSWDDTEGEGEQQTLWGYITGKLSAIWEWLSGLFDFDLGSAVEGLLPSWTPGWVRSALGLGDGGDGEESESPADGISNRQALINEARDRMERSSGGENVYWGRDSVGRSEDLAEIQRLQAEIAEMQAQSAQPVIINNSSNVNNNNMGSQPVPLPVQTIDSDFSGRAATSDF
jgi:hypothetical protein